MSSCVFCAIAAMLAYACGHLFWPHARYADQAEQASYARRLQRALDPASWRVGHERRGIVQLRP